MEKTGIKREHYDMSMRIGTLYFKAFFGHKKLVFKQLRTH